MENVLTSLADEIEFVRRHKLKFCVGTGIFCFLAGLPCCTRGGQYIFEILDNYGGSIPLVFIAICECIAIMWIYGFDRLSFDIKFMLDANIGKYWLITWKYTSPIILTFIFIYSFIQYRPLQYGEYNYPSWANLLGVMISLSVAIQIPAWALYALWKQKKVDSLKEVCRKTLN